MSYNTSMTDNEKLAEAKKLAEANYESWGQWVVECMSDDDIVESFINIHGQKMTLEQWVELRKSVASIYKEYESTAW